jgi:hypothetical protein
MEHKKPCAPQKFTKSFTQLSIAKGVVEIPLTFFPLICTVAWGSIYLSLGWVPPKGFGKKANVVRKNSYGE